MKYVTKFELYNEVQKTYKGFLTLKKAKMLYEMETGHYPKIIEEKVDMLGITQNLVKRLNEIEDTYVTTEQLIWMKKMQEKGTHNMLVGEITNIIQTTFYVDPDGVKDIQKIYMKYYNELYNPETLI